MSEEIRHHRLLMAIITQDSIYETGGTMRTITIYTRTDDHGDDYQCEHTHPDCSERIRITEKADGVLYLQDRWIGSDDAGEWHATNECELVTDETYDQILDAVRCNIIMFEGQ